MITLIIYELNTHPFNSEQLTYVIVCMAADREVQLQFRWGQILCRDIQKDLI